MQKIKLTVGITSWHNRRTVVDNINSIFKSRDLDFEVLVYDQATQHGFPDPLAELSVLAPRVVVKWSQTNTGQSVSRNWIMDNAKGEFLLFLDADITLIPGSVDAMLAYMERCPGLLGIHYDVRSDTPNQETSTPSECGITDADMEEQRLLMFHYAMYRTDMIRKFRLPVFPPFDGPGWGVEEDVAHLHDPLATTRMIKYRKFWHHQEGRSHNFLKAQMVRSRALRWIKWCILKQQDQALTQSQLDSACAQGYILNGLKLVENKQKNFISIATREMFYEFFPMATNDHLANTVLLFEYEKATAREVYGSDAYVRFETLPTSASPLWLLACMPSHENTMDRFEWVTNAKADQFTTFPSIFEYRKWLSGLKAVSVQTRSIWMHLINALIGMPTMLEQGLLAGEETELLQELGLKPKMNYNDCQAFRQLHQQACLNRVIVPMVNTLLKYT